MASPLSNLTRVDGLHAPLGDDEEEEIIYLALELGAVDPSLIPHCASMRLVGLETPTPFLQLGDSVFRGLHVSTLGTELIFHDASPDTSNRSIEPFAHTEHKILFNPVILTPKSDPAAEPASASGPSSRDTKTADAPASGRGSGGARRAGRPRGRGGSRGRGRADN